MVCPAIRNEQKPWLLEGCLDLVSEVSRTEVASNRGGLSISYRFQCVPLASSPEGDDANIRWIFSGNHGVSCWQKLLPGSLHTYDVDATTFLFVDIMFHLKVKVGAT